MNWRAKLAWIGRTDSGVVRKRLYERGIDYLGLSVLDPGAAVWAATIRNEGKQPFFYTDPHWFDMAADGFALRYRQRIDADLARLGALPNELLMVDLEQVSQEYVRRLLNGSSGNRGLVGSNNPDFAEGTQAARPIAYTNEPFKDGTVAPLGDIARAGLHFYPQTYYGDMSPADVGAVSLDLVRWLEAAGQFNAADLVHVFYDGLKIAPDQRDGSYFTAERIPGVFSSAGLAQIWKPEIFTKNSLRTYYRALAAVTRGE